MILSRALSLGVAFCAFLTWAGGPAAAGSPELGDGVAASAGAEAPGSTQYAPPAGAVFLSPSGSDSDPGSLDRPVKTLGRALALAPDGGTVVVRRGSYHQSAVVTKTVTVQNYPGEEVWFDGSEAVSGWVQDGSRWRHDGWTTRFDSSPTYTKGAPDSTQKDWQFVNPNAPMAAHPDQMWVDGVRLSQAASLGALTSGGFYLDESSSRLYLGSDPNGKFVSASTLAQALNVRASGVTLRGIGFRKFAPSVWHLGAIVLEKPDATVENVSVQDMSTTGLSILAVGAKLRDVTVQRSGMLGIHGRYADKLSMSGVLSQENNNEHFNIAPVSGGAKIGQSRGVLVENSEFSNNYGPGFWQDISTYDSTYRGDTFSNNAGNGLFLEISAKAVVGDSLFSGNRMDGIKVNNTSDVQIWNNTLVGNGRPLDFVQDDRRNTNRNDPAVDSRIPWPDPQMPWQLQSVTASNNVVGPPSSAANCLLCVEDYSHQQSAEAMKVVANGNIYVRASDRSPSWLAVWSSGPGNPAVFSSLAALINKTGQEKNGREFVSKDSVSSDGTVSTSIQSQAPQVARPLPTAVAEAIGRVGAAPHLGAWTESATDPGGSSPIPTDPAPAAGTELFHDEFNRTMTGGWGSADAGGAWTTTDAPDRYSVAEGKGRVTLQSGDGFNAQLPQVASDRTDLVASLSVDKQAGAVGHYLDFTPRKVGSTGGYTAKLRLASDGSVTLWLLGSVRGAHTYYSQATVPGITYTAGDKLFLRVQVVGTSPTVIRARVWKDGTTEPTAWAVEAQDSTAELQAPGSVNLFSYTAGAADNQPTTVRYHRVVVARL